MTQAASDGKRNKGTASMNLNNRLTNLREVVTSATRESSELHHFYCRQPWLHEAWTVEELEELSTWMNVERWKEDDRIIAADETSSWFGVVLSGTLSIDGGMNRDAEKITNLGVGDIFGEMAMWHPASKRSASVRAASLCKVASLSVENLRALIRDRTTIGIKLMRTLGRVAVNRQTKNAQRERSRFVGTNFGLSSAVEVSGGETANIELHEAYRARLVGHLAAQLAASPPDGVQFDDTELTRLIDSAQFCRFHKGDRLVSEGEKLNGVTVLLVGSAWIDKWGIELAEGSILGCHDFFGVTVLSALSPTVAKSDGVVAGWTTNQIAELLQADGVFAHKLITFLGRFAHRLGAVVGQVMTEEVVLPGRDGEGDAKSRNRHAKARSGGPKHTVGDADRGHSNGSAAEAMYLEKLHEQAERLRMQLQETELLKSKLQQKTQSEVRYKLLHASAATRFQAANKEKRERDLELLAQQALVDDLRNQVNHEQCTSADSIKLMTRLITAVSSAFDKLGISDLPTDIKKTMQAVQIIAAEHAQKAQRPTPCRVARVGLTQGFQGLHDEQTADSALSPSPRTTNASTSADKTTKVTKSVAKLSCHGIATGTVPNTLSTAVSAPSTASACEAIFVTDSVVARSTTKASASAGPAPVQQIHAAKSSLARKDVDDPFGFATSFSDMQRLNFTLPLFHVPTYTNRNAAQVISLLQRPPKLAQGMKVLHAHTLQHELQKLLRHAWSRYLQSKPTGLKCNLAVHNEMVLVHIKKMLQFRQEDIVPPTQALLRLLWTEIRRGDRSAVGQCSSERSARMPLLASAACTWRS